MKQEYKLEALKGDHCRLSFNDQFVSCPYRVPDPEYPRDRYQDCGTHCLQFQANIYNNGIACDILLHCTGRTISEVNIKGILKKANCP